MPLSLLLHINVVGCNSAGEVAEYQKQELEKYQATVKRQETELVEVRQQLAKLSEIVDRQTDDMKQLNAEARLAVTNVAWNMLRLLHEKKLTYA